MIQSSAQLASQNPQTEEILNADPHQLVNLLFDGALERLHHAKSYMEVKDFEGKGNAIGSVISIIGALQGGLNFNEGEEIAVNLFRLYDYMMRRLCIASEQNDPKILDEVVGLIGEIKEGWGSIQSQSKRTQQAS